MLCKQAKILSPLDVADVLAFTDCTRHPLRNRVIVLLSAKAGLRAGEIAHLTWDMGTVRPLPAKLAPRSNCATAQQRTEAVA